MTQGLRDLANEDEKIQCVLCRVAKHDGESEFWEVNAEGQISIDVITLKSHNPLTAILCGGGGDNKGVWMIPAEGTECVVSFDVDGYEGDAVLVGLMGQSPNGLTAEKILILHDKVEIRSVDGVAEPLATLSDVQELRDELEGHDHSATGLLCSNGTISGTTGSLTGLPQPAGTEILEAE